MRKIFFLCLILILFSIGLSHCEETAYEKLKRQAMGIPEPNESNKKYQRDPILPETVSEIDCRQSHMLNLSPEDVLTLNNYSR